MKGYPIIDAEMEALERERTDWAEERTLLANERTLSAWMRTGLAAVVAGLGIAHLLEPRGWPAISRTIGAIFVLSGGGAYIVGVWRYRQVYGALKHEGTKVTSFWLLGTLVLALIVSAGLSFVLLLRW